MDYFKACSNVSGVSSKITQWPNGQRMLIMKSNL